VAVQRKPATLADVARLARVSAMTVSRVINDPATVSAETQGRVRHAMHQLNYRPNPMARGLARGRSNTIGVVTFDTGQYGPGSTLLAIERAARVRGYGVALAVAEGPDRLAVREAVLSLADRRVDGLVVIAPFVEASGALLDLGSHIPLVAAEAGHPGEATVVSIDQVLGAKLATEHLLTLGHRTVHHIAGPSDWIESGLRIAGWREALSSAGRAAPPLLTGDWTPRSGFAAGLQLADDPSVTAIFVANDQMALGVLSALHQQGRRVPDDVSVVGFDDTLESAYYLPALTTIRQDFAAMGEAAVDSLDRLVTAEVPPPASVTLVPPTLVHRQSTGPAIVPR
jgi:DNA-binding LacI/PurR family transcriptional regulator